MAQMRVIDVPTRLPLVPVIDGRQTTVTGDSVNNPNAPDARLINAIMEKDEATGELLIRKRLGLGTILYDRSATSIAGLGMYSFSLNTGNADKLIQIYRTSLTNARLYSDNALITNLTMSNSDRYLPFDFETIIGTPNNLLFFKNRDRGYTFDGTTVTQVTDVDYPSSVPGIAQLNGTTYLMDVYGNIRGSAISDPTSWDPLNSIQANNVAGAGIGIARHLAYVVAFKRNSTEVFYDAGNAVGSPLTRVPGALIMVGCIAGNSIQSLGDTVFWMSKTKDSPPQISMMTDLKHRVVSTPAVDRLLSGFNPGLGVYLETKVISMAFQYAGHKYYVLTLLTLNLTLIYDATVDQFYKWTDTDGGLWPLNAQAFKDTGELLFQGINTANVIYAGNEFYSDESVLFPVDIYPPNFDAGVDRKKTLSILKFNADQVSGSELLVRCSDDDYASWSNFRRLDLSLKRPILANCGTFYRRGYHFRHLKNTKFRIKSVDLQMEIGSL